MSSQARLCRELIREDFGPFAAKVANQMLLKGRLSLFDLVRFTNLTQKQVRESLVVLIHHGLVHFTEPEPGQRGSTFYQADANKITMRLRIGPILRVTQEQYGQEAVNVCKILYTHGRMRLGDVLEYISETEGKTKKKMTDYIRAFTKLAVAGLITAILPEHSRSNVDRFIEAQEKEAEKYTITTAKDIQAIKKAAQAQVEAEFAVVEGIGMKRKAVDSLGSENKRAARKADDTADDVEIDEKIFFTINYDKYNMIFRNNAIIDYATERINRTAGQVIKAFLDFGKDKMKSLQEADSPSTTPLHIVNMLSSDLLTQGDIVLQPDPTDPNRKPSANDVVKGYIMLLKTDQAGFITSKDERGANQYAVNFAKLRETMKRRVFEGLLRDKFGMATCRIVRILLEKGKLEETQITKLAMLPPKDTREKLALLNAKGVVEIQEVPKSADRAPSRTFHLWYVPLEKCYQELLVDVYRAIGNIQQRKQKELEMRSRLLDKLNREDVMANMDLLSEADKRDVDEMNKVLLRLETSKKRLDEIIMIFRDF